MLFGTIGAGTPLWLVVGQMFVYGFFTSLQYTSMNTLVYADVTEEEASGASTIASTMQQMAISFGVAISSLATVFFIPAHLPASSPEMIHASTRPSSSWAVGRFFPPLFSANSKAKTATPVSLHKDLPAIG